MPLAVYQYRVSNRLALVVWLGHSPVTAKDEGVMGKDAGWVVGERPFWLAGW